jgi:tetratricopeptide (TPR) repeat protein
MHTLLRAYGKGLETDAALQEAYKTNVETIQASFDAKLEKEFGAMRRALKTPDVPDEAGVDGLRAAVQANPESFALHMRLGMALRKGGDAAGAIRELERAAQLLPGYTGNDSPNALIATIALEQKDTARAVQALEAVLRVDGNDVDSARKLASLLPPQGDPARAAVAYGRVVALDPFDSGAESAFGRLALQRREVPLALRAFRAALASTPSDEAAAQLDLAEGYLAAGDRAEAKKHALAALEIAPSFERAQDVLLKIVDAGAGGER